MGFFDEINQANTEFAKHCSEGFEVAKNGALGTYTAVNIDDVTSEAVKMAGGAVADVEVNVYVTKAVYAEAEIAQGTILVVRGKRVRVGPVVDDGDNLIMLNCQTAGIKI